MGTGSRIPAGAGAQPTGDCSAPRRLAAWRGTTCGPQGHPGPAPCSLSVSFPLVQWGTQFLFLFWRQDGEN